MDEPLKDIPTTVFADDDGSADARLAQVLIQYSHAKAPLSDVVDALAYARVLVPVVAHGDQREMGCHGVEKDVVASAGIAAVATPDGRRALPVFTDVAAMKAWSETARPIPAEGPRAAQSAVAEDWSVLVINPGMETVVVPRPAVWALAKGESWRPAVTGGQVAADVRSAIADAVPTGGPLLAVDAVPGQGAELAVVLTLVAGLSQPELDVVVARVQEGLAGAALIAERVDSLELRLTGA